MTQERVAEICLASSTTEEAVWDLLVDKRIEYRAADGPVRSIERAIEEVSETLRLEIDEGRELYAFLHEKNME